MEMQHRTRIVWIDWMKVIGMYFIILGHFFPLGYVYIYTFNVPVFFIISGYLCKKKNSHLQFWKIIIKKYVTPLIFISTAMYLWNYLTWEQDEKATKSLLFLYYALIGSQKCLGTGWFIYSLIIIRVLFQYSSSSKIAHLFFFCLFSFISIYLQHHNIHHFNAITNVATAYPLFIIGHNLNEKNEIINSDHTIRSMAVLSIIAIFSIYMCGKLNGEVWMYNNDYGKSYILFLLGSISGTIIIYILSVMLGQQSNSIIQTLSIGNIVTLGFHPIIVKAIEHHGNLIDYVYSFCILIMFYPIIIFATKYFPYLLGLDKPTKKNEYK